MVMQCNAKLLPKMLRKRLDCSSSSFHRLRRLMNTLAPLGFGGRGCCPWGYSMLEQIHISRVMIAIYLPYSELLEVAPNPDHQEDAGLDPPGVGKAAGAVREA